SGFLPKKTALLQNYPNPFNPETWIPYHLARSAAVEITIFDSNGRLVRRLALGHQGAGYYVDPERAAYWDGRNDDGESVASGVYVYRLRAADYSAARRMVIVK
ncbi:MAG: T9SS type A sorting domain-containing protein, partial [Candidatus Poribacteria bacterium]|nr:T9SS type A sorting domain-containing protein [Candidatus Poribacteria bacterium]